MSVNSLVIDGHCHVSDVWYEPVETLLYEMDRNGVEKAVLVQLLGQYDNTYQQQACAQYPDRFSSVVGIDTEAADASDQLHRLADEGIAGVRLRPTSRSPGDDPLAIWHAVAERNLAVSCVAPMAMFLNAEFVAVLNEFSNTPVVLEHLGGIARPDADDRKDEILALARFDNVSLKVPGLGQLAPRARLLAGTSAGEGKRPLGDDAAEWLHKAVSAFGPSRLMWGSDFPPVASREGYRNALNWSREALSGLAESDLQQIYGGTAARVFGC